MILTFFVNSCHAAIADEIGSLRMTPLARMKAFEAAKDCISELSKRGVMLHPLQYLWERTLATGLC